MPPEHPAPRIFTLDEALIVFPRVTALTDRAVGAAAVVEAQLVAVKESAERRKERHARRAGAKCRESGLR